MLTGKRLRVVLLGAGSLGRAFLRRLGDEKAPVDLVGIATARHGRMLSREGIDPTVALNTVEAGELGQDGPEDFGELLNAVGADAIVECIPQNIRSGDPALGYQRASLELGVHVVTSNKSPIALGYRDLRHRAAKSGKQFRFEATVLDGLPVFAFASQLGNDRITKVRAVLNGTSSVVLETLGQGSTRARGLARAQARGIAEADPVLDLDGWDAAAKAALLANVWMEGSLRVVDVVRKGLETLKDKDVAKAAEEQLHYRLVADIVRDEAGARASVAPVALEPGDPFHTLRGPRGGIEIETESGRSFCMLQGTAGLEDAAAGIVADLEAILLGAPQP